MTYTYCIVNFELDPEYEDEWLFYFRERDGYKTEKRLRMHTIGTYAADANARRVRLEVRECRMYSSEYHYYYLQPRYVHVRRDYPTRSLSTWIPSFETNPGLHRR
jgi:hypothetical protein